MKSRVLLVDDDTSLLESMLKLLKLEFGNTTFDVATRAELAIELAKERNPDVVVLDLSLNR